MSIRFQDYRAWGNVMIRPLLGSLLALQLSIAGCAVGPNFVRPEPPPVDRYTQGEKPVSTIPAEGQAQHFEEAAKVDANWWRLFNSPKLDTVMKEAFSNNQSLQAAEASLRQSQENLRAGYGVFYPQVDTSLNIARHKSSVVSFSGSTISNIFNLYTLAATVSYALDVFGGERRAVESLRAQVDYQHYTVLGVYLTLSGNIVNTIIAQAGYREQIEATEQTIDLEKEQINIAESQAQAGTIPYSNLLSLEAQLSTTQAALPSLKQKLSQADHLLATLVGRAPGEWSSPHVGLADLTLPSDLPLSLPSKLVRQRPDILAAEEQLHAASAQIGVATAALFPNFTLSGVFGLNSTSLENLAKDTVSFWTLGANVTAPIFQGGSLWFGRRAVIEGYNQSLANYREIVLSALAQVADTLRALEHDAEIVQAQSEALGEAKEALELIQVNYQAGTVNYLQVLVANYQYYQARISYVQALAQRLQDTVAFYVALGGGWWNAERNVTNN
jgi:NodT family efflux transporter outer membrane factor (OMF) lipoprotein